MEPVNENFEQKQVLETKLRELESSKSDLQDKIDDLENYAKKAKRESETLYEILGQIANSFWAQNPKLTNLTAQQTYTMDRRKLIFF